MALQVGDIAPDFCLDSHLGHPVRLSDYRNSRNIVLAFFPLAWTPIWTGQIPSYQASLDRFDGVRTQVLGISVDSVPCLQAWAESLTGISYPLLSDFYPHGKVAQSYGVLRSEGYSERALFIIDKQGVIRYVDVHDIDHQPDNEVLFAELEKLEPYYAAQYAARIAAEKKPEPQKPVDPTVDVVLYCTPWCPACRRVRAFLRENQIAFEEINIMQDRAAAAQVREWNGGHETTPTLNVRGTIVIDYDQNRVAKLLGIK